MRECVVSYEWQGRTETQMVKGDTRRVLLKEVADLMKHLIELGSKNVQKGKIRGKPQRSRMDNSQHRVARRYRFSRA